MPPNRLSSLGRVNYRNIGLMFAFGLLMELEKEVDDPKATSLQGRLVKKTIDDLGELIKILPDDVFEEEVARGCHIFKLMELGIMAEPEYHHLLELPEAVDLIKRINLISGELINDFNNISADGSEGQEVHSTDENAGSPENQAESAEA